MQVSDRALVERFPGEPLDRDNAFFYRGLLDRQVLMLRCADCGWWHHPAGPVCPRCWSSAVSPTAISGAGTIHLLIRLHQGPPAPGIDYITPHPVATVELDEQDGLRFTACLTGDHAAARIGDRVRLTWIERAGVAVPAFEVIGR